MQYTSPTIDRGEFIRKGSLVAVSVALFGCSHANGTEHTPECETTPDILGPFFKSGAPNRSDIREEGDTGALLTVKGSVYSDDCITQLTDARIEVWQADGTGAYDNDGFRYRAMQNSTGEGTYSFSTNLPGKYLNGSSFRPSHIHIQVTADGHRTLVSQIYFENDTDIPADPWASSDAAQERILAITDLDGGEKEVTFDIFMVLDT